MGPSGGVSSISSQKLAIEMDKEIDLDLDLAGSKGLIPLLNPNTKKDIKFSPRQNIALMSEPKLLSANELATRKIIHSQMKDRRVANIYRDLRTKLLQLSQGRNFTIMVCSICAKGGASFAVINLAAAFSFDDRKTSLLVDCNLYNASLHKIMNVEPKLGVIDFLQDSSISVENIIVPTGIHRLRLISIGKQRESAIEAFNSTRMAQFIDAVQERYKDRYIFIDAPPLGESADTKILADLCDYIIIIIPYGKVTEAKITNTLKEVDKEKLVGVIFNHQHT